MAAPESRPTLETMSELEKRRQSGFWFRKWESADISSLCMVIARHVLGCCAPFVFDWGAFWVAVGLVFFSGFGVTLGYHILLTHRSFKIPKWLEYFFVYCGVHGGQKDPMFWVSVHKNHHKYADTERDPHTPMEGFWFSHMGWFCYNDYIAAKGMRQVVANNFTFLGTSATHVWGQRPWNTPDASTNNWWVAIRLDLGVNQVARDGWIGNRC